MIQPEYTPDYTNVCERFLKVVGQDSAQVIGRVQYNTKSYELYKAVLGKGNPYRALITAGIHGDEPAGVEALLAFLERGQEQRWRNQWELTLVPCLNPSGFDAGTRESSAGVDLNRQFKEKSVPEEVSLIRSLFDRPFDLDLELHEDIDTPGYYLYQKETGPLSSLGRMILDSVALVMPLNLDEEIEEMPASNGLISRLNDPDEMEWWPMALYAHQQECHRVFTLETSVRFPMETRIQAHLTALHTALSTHPKI